MSDEPKAPPDDARTAEIIKLELKQAGTIGMVEFGRKLETQYGIQWTDYQVHVHKLYPKTPNSAGIVRQMGMICWQRRYRGA